MPEPVTGSREAALSIFNSEPYLQQLSSLTSPVPDFAATLSAQAEQEAEDDNIRFLRSHLLTDDPQNNRETTSHRHMNSEPETASRRYTPEQLQELNDLEERAQQIVRQEYDGWAPGTSDDDEEDPRPTRTRPATTMLDEQAMRQDDNLRDRMRIRRLRDHFATQVAEGASRHQEYADPPLQHPSRFVENGMGSAIPSTESSLRTTAMLQAVRQNTAMSPHSRSQLQRYILDRERTGLDAEESDRQRSNSSIAHLSPSQRRQVQREQSVRQEIQQHRDLLAEHQQHRNFLEEQLRQQQLQRYGPLPSTEHRRRRLWQNTSAHCPSINSMSMTENTIRYLESLTLCELDSEGILAANDSGFDPNDLCPHNSDDFLLNTTLLLPPPSTSWLHIGSVLSGTQHAMPTTSAPFNSIGRFAAESRTRIRHPTLGTSTARTTSPVRSSNPSILPALPPHVQQQQLRQQRIHQQQVDEDRWPVKVSIHSIDHDTMTLAGTMEAFNVPDKSSPTNKSSITTYLEGEIIDFNTFTLETKSFEASTHIDATYWRKLPPFKDLKNEDAVVKSLLSKEWLSKELMEKWVLMRWKEKHFVTPSDAHSSLSINGFYYISMRRFDGHVEGLYYDKNSTPYQHLNLKPDMRTFPAYEFR